MLEESPKKTLGYHLVHCAIYISHIQTYHNELYAHLGLNEFQECLTIRKMCFPVRWGALPTGRSNRALSS